jgi:SAM-dependent methyltransferase
VRAHPDFTGASIVHCARCRYWFASPEPGEAELARHYAGAYSLARRAAYGTEYLSLMNRRAASQVRFIERHTGPLAGRRALDAGCGIGALVRALATAGCEAVGYDADEAAVDEGRRQGANVHTGLAPAGGDYDLLTASHVLEHLPNLRAALPDLAARVHEGGFLFIEVPNSFDALFGPAFDAESHLHFFTPASLRQWLEAASLEVVAITTCGPPRERLIPARPRPIADALLHVLRNARLIGGPYDKWFGRYYDDNAGMWIRAVARVRRPG